MAVAGVGRISEVASVAAARAPPLSAASVFCAHSVALAALWPARQPDKLVFVGAAASRFQVAAVPPELHERTLVIHGEHDDTVPLAAVMDWARPQVLPVTVVPGGSHFFHGQLPLLKSLVVRHLTSTI